MKTNFVQKLERWLQAAKAHYPWEFMALIICSYVFPAMYGILNRYFIGYMNYDSVVVDQSFEALEVVFEVVLEMFPLAVLALIARMYTQVEKVKSVILASILLQSIITVVFVIVSLIFMPNFIDWIHTPASVTDLAEQYFRIKTFSFPLQAMAAVFVIAIKALKKGKLAVLLSLATVLMNFFLDAIFISNYTFSLQLGLIGSAWDYFFANLFSCCLSGGVLWYYLRGKKRTEFSFWDTTKKIFQIGKWIGLESAIRNVGYIMGVVAVVNIIGATEPNAIGGYNTAMWIMWVITLIPILAWTEATNIAVGHAYGEGKVQAMKDIQALSTLLMAIYMGAWVLIGAWWWSDISTWLNSGISEDVALYSVRTFQVLIVPYMFYVIGSGLKAFYIGTGKPAWVFLSSAIVNVAIYIPLGLVAGSPGIVLTYQGFLGITFAVFSLDLVLTILFLRYRGYNRLPNTGIPG